MASPVEENILPVTSTSTLTITSALTIAKENYHFTIPGAFFLLIAFTLLLKLIFRKTPQKALKIFVGADHLNFKAKTFKEKGFWRDVMTRTCEDIKIEVYSVKHEKFSFYELSDRKTLVKAPIELEEPVQIRYKYKDGLFWTAWSQKIKKTIQRPPFQLQAYTENLQNQQQPAQTEENFYDNLCQEFRQRINNAPENINIRLMGRIGTGKSSLINTFFSAFTTTWRVPITYGRGYIDRQVLRHELVPDQVRLVDMPGWQNNYAFQMMGDIVRGMYDDMPSDMQQNDQRRRVNQAPGLNEGPREEEKNAIILVVAAEDARGDDVNRRVVQEIIELGKH